MVLVLVLVLMLRLVLLMRLGRGAQLRCKAARNFCRSRSGRRLYLVFTL
jgi:hypothetical protein